MKRSRTREENGNTPDQDMKELLKRFEEQLEDLAERMRKDGYKVRVRVRHRHER